MDAFLPIEDVVDETPVFYFAWAGGFLTSDTAIIVLLGRTKDDPEWSRSYRVDVRSGQVEGQFDGGNEHPYDLQPLGDGTWLTTDPGGHPIRWSNREQRHLPEGATAAPAGQSSGGW
ncbi:hypothetical protein ACGFNU_37210 [Spirillospora sp. NPDC048911]|uniref:hypothetical protein n=1 Tax=Spirillospora sp. NPDC048911 TaxID=3364527 RepID=UPI0037136222